MVFVAVKEQLMHAKNCFKIFTGAGFNYFRVGLVLLCSGNPYYCTLNFTIDTEWEFTYLPWMRVAVIGIYKKKKNTN